MAAIIHLYHLHYLGPKALNVQRGYTVCGQYMERAYLTVHKDDATCTACAAKAAATEPKP